MTVILFFMGIWGYLQTMHAQKTIHFLITQTFKNQTGHDIEIEGLSFPMPFHCLAYQVKIKENENTWLTIDEMGFSISFWQFLNEGLALHHVFLKNPHLLNLPGDQTLVSTTDLETILWTTFPYRIKISNIHLENLIVNSAVLGDGSVASLFPLNIQGSFFLNPKSYVANIDLSMRQEGKQAGTHLHFTCQGSPFNFHFDVLEKKQGLLSEIINLSMPYDLLFSMEGKEDAGKNFDGRFHLSFLKEKAVSFANGIKGNFFYSPDGLLKASSIEGMLGFISLAGELSLTTHDLKIHDNELRLNIVDCSALKYHCQWPFEGSMQAIANLSGSLNAPTANLKIHGSGLKIQNEPIQNFFGETTLSKSSFGLDGHSFFSFEFRQTMLKTVAHFFWNEKKISLSDIHADYGSAQLNGVISYFFDKNIFEGKMEAKAEDSTIFKTLFDINVHGSTDITAKFYSEDSFEDNQLAQGVDFNVRADHAHYEHLRVEQATLSGIIRNAFHHPALNLTLKAKHALYSGWRLQELTAETSIDDSKNYWPFHLATSDSNDLSVKAHGRWKATPNDFYVHLEALQGSLKKHPFSLEDPASLTMNKDVFDLSPVTLTFDKGTFYTTIDYSKDQAHTTTRLKNVPIEIFQSPKFVTPFSGTISGEVDLFGTPGELKGQLHAQLSQVKIHDEAFQHHHPFDLNLSGSIAQTHIEGSAQITGITAKPIEIKAHLPVSINLNPPNVEIDDEAALSAHIVAEGEIAPLLQLLVIETSSLSGKTSASLDITGSIRNPHIDGEITISDGTFESPSTGAVFHHLNARLQARDKNLTLKEFKALDLNDGIIQGNGDLKLAREEGFPFTLNLQLSRIRLLNLDFAKSIASGRVIVTGNSRQGKVQGRLITDSLQLTIPEQVSALDHSLDVKYINHPRGEVAPVFTTARPRWPLELDIQIDVPKNATIKSKNLSSFWKGSVKVQGMPNTPLYFGDLKIVKGEYHYNGQTFDIKEGTISFAGEAEKKTTLYVIANKDLGKINAEVILKGPVKNPVIAFRSNPPMPQREILSWILFGRGSTEITPFQGAELSQSISNLTKSNQKPDVLTKIRDSFGLDRIDISKTEGNESNEVSVQVGKYISRGVLVKINKSITSETNQIGIEANVLPNIKAEAQVGDDASTQLQLKWKKDY